MNLFARRTAAAASLRPRYAYRITIGGRVHTTTDYVEVVRIRRAYPSAQVQIVPVG